MMKKIALISLILINSAVAKPIVNYQEAVVAISQGAQLKYVIDWDMCKINLPIKPNFATSYTPTNVNIDKSGFIQSRGIIFAPVIRAFPQLKNVNQAYEYIFTKNNELTAINYFLDAVTYEEKMSAITAVCQLGVGFKVFASIEK